jgi:hypothetical protein
VNGKRLFTMVAVIVVVVTTTMFLLLAGSSSLSTASTAPSGTADRIAHAAGATTLAGTGVPGFNGGGRTAVDAQLDDPTGVVEDASGDLFIADGGNCRVREVPARTGLSFGIHVHEGDLVTVAGGPCSNSRANPAPSALAVDPGGDLFIAFGSAARVEELPAASTTAFGMAVTTGRITTVAGNGHPGFGGDGGPTRQSTLDDPTGVAVDAAGDLLIADTGNCRLRLVAASTGTRFGVPVVRGHIYTVAGNGICGSSGDGGPALEAELWDPGALAVDTGGDVVVADQGNRTIRELTARSGTFFGVNLTADHLGTVAGEGSYGPYLVDGLSALGETAEINFPTGIALDAHGDLYIADGSIHAIRFVPASTTTLLGKPAKADDMYTAAGAVSTGTLDNGTRWVQTRLLDPTGLTMSPGGRLIYSDGQVDVVRELPAAS